MNETRKDSGGNFAEFVLRDYVRELPIYDGDLDINARQTQRNCRQSFYEFRSSL